MDIRKRTATAEATASDSLAGGETKDIALIIGTVVAALTLIKAVFEYTKQNAQKRAEHYTHLREEFKKEGRFGDIFEKLEDDAQELATLGFEKKTRPHWVL